MLMCFHLHKRLSSVSLFITNQLINQTHFDGLKYKAFQCIIVFNPIYKILYAFPYMINIKIETGAVSPSCRLIGRAMLWHQENRKWSSGEQEVVLLEGAGAAGADATRQVGEMEDRQLNGETPLHADRRHHTTVKTTNHTKKTTNHTKKLQIWMQRICV